MEESRKGVEILKGAPPLFGDDVELLNAPVVNVEVLIDGSKSKPVELSWYW